MTFLSRNLDYTEGDLTKNFGNTPGPLSYYGCPEGFPSGDFAFCTLSINLRRILGWRYWLAGLSSVSFPWGSPFVTFRSHPPEWSLSPSSTRELDTRRQQRFDSRSPTLWRVVQVEGHCRHLKIFLWIHKKWCLLFPVCSERQSCHFQNRKGFSAFTRTRLWFQTQWGKSSNFGFKESQWISQSTEVSSSVGRAVWPEYHLFGEHPNLRGQRGRMFARWVPHNAQCILGP